MYAKLLFCALIVRVAAVAAEPAIIEAARSGDIAKLRQLAQTKDELKARGSQNQTALHEAAAKCDADAVQLLLDAGVDRLIRDNSNRTASAIAGNCLQSADANRLIRLLMTPQPRNAVAETAPWSLQDAAARGNISVLKMLLSLGADVNAPGSKGNLALELACRNGRVEAVQILLDRGADIRLRTAAGTTVLHEAALGGNPDVIAALIERGADVNGPDDETGATPLHYAAGFGRADAVRALLQRGADASRKNRKGRTPLDTARTNGQEAVVAILRTVN